MLDVTFAPWVNRWAGNHRTAFVFEGFSVSYGTFHDRIKSVAFGLRAAGIGPGDRVAFCGLNRLELFEVLFGCAEIGAVFLPLNNRLTATELAFQIDDSDPSIILTTDGYHELIERAAGDRPIRDLDVVGFPDQDSPVREPDGDLLERVAVAEASPALMVYTSGTTGQPKGAVLTHGSLHYTILNSIDHQDLTEADCIIAPLPTFHVGGLNIQTLPALAVGATVLLQRRFDPGDVLELIDQYRPTQTLLVPAMLDAVARHPRFGEVDLSCLRGINTGSSVVPESVMQPYFDRGVPIGQVYGATETGPTAVVLRYDEAFAHRRSCGRPAQHTEVRIVAEDGIDCLDDEPGELWLRGPNLFTEYWQSPEATHAAFVDGWYRSGDIGHRDRDGYIYISDRVDDMFISGGENVYPAEVESVLIEHPDIAEVAVLGRADERWGQVGIAVVVPVDGSDPNLDGVQEWCRDRLARFKHPRALVTVEALPRTALGKVQKHLLRADGLTSRS